MTNWKPKPLSAFLALLCTAALYAAPPAFEETFEDPKNPAFNGLQIESENPASGKYCARLTGTHNAHSKKFIPVEPARWYRLSVRNRNDVKNGALQFGLLESRSAEKQVSKSRDWHWRSVSVNMPEWHTDVLEFKTLPDTHGVRLYIRSENKFTGSSWWDDVKLEKFEKILPPMEFKPFRAAATFTDIPTKMAYAQRNGKRCPASVKRDKTEYCWETMDLAREKLELSYRELPANSVLNVSLRHGEKTLFQQQQKLSGSGTAAFNVGLEKLPEGIYLFQAELLQPGKEPFRLQKELWRISSRFVSAPKLEPVRTTKAGDGRQLLLNGKIFNPVYNSFSPAWGNFDHLKNICKPDLATYIRTLQEQFGQTLFSKQHAHRHRGTPKPEYLKKAVAECRAYLDFLQSVNSYASVSILVYTPHKEAPDWEEIRGLVRGIKDHPALFQWSFDEPEIHRYAPEVMRKYYQVVREEDPAHLIHVNLCVPHTFHLYTPYSDIASFDIYPFPGSSLLESRSRIRKLLASAPQAPYQSYLQMFNFANMDMPDFDQLRASFLLDRICGSHSLISYAWADPSQSFMTDYELQSYYRAVVAMFRRLEPVLRNPAKEQIKIAASQDFVDSGTFEDGNDQVLLLVNLSNAVPMDVSFAHPSKEAVDFFDAAWSYPQKDGKFQFRLAPNESKVLRLKIK